MRSGDGKDQDRLCVLVQNIAGKKLTLEFSQPFRVSVMKDQIAIAWEIPRNCQRLVLGTKILNDSASLSSVTHPDIVSTPVTVLVALESVIRTLEKRCNRPKNFANQIQALLDLNAPGMKLSATSDHRVIDALVGCMDELRHAGTPEIRQGQQKVQQLAADTLCAQVNGGNEHVIIALLSRLSIGSALRPAIRHVLESVAERRNTAFTSALIGQPEHDYPYQAMSDVYEATFVAVKALGKVAFKGDKHAIVAVCTYLEAIEGVARNGAVCQKCLCACSSSHDTRLLVEVLGTIAPANDPDAIEALLSCFGDFYDQVRLAAVQALSCVATIGHEHTVHALILRLRHHDQNVRRAAAQAVGKISRAGDAIAIHAVRCCLEDPKETVRDAAAEAIRVLLDGADSCTEVNEVQA